MRPVAWMVGASVVSWLIVTRVAGGSNPEVLCGMLGPLAVAAVSWIVTERTYRSQPDRLMGVMVQGLAVKAVLFGAYVAGMLRVAGLRPVPFVVSFTGYFIALHVMEAMYMHRLFTSAAAAPPLRRDES
jgi:hypothetical protein